MKPCKAKTITSWILQLIAAVILFQTLFFKFTGAEESKYSLSSNPTDACDLTQQAFL